MNESTVWSYLKQGMKHYWIAFRIESCAGNGVPDVCFAMPGFFGFIELKYIKEWPVRPSTLVKLPLRPEQVLWIKRYGSCVGKVWAFIRIEDDFFLLTWEQALEACQGWAKEYWLRYSLRRWHGRVDFTEISQDLNKG